MAKKALITGITGQDGSYLAELLLSKGYEVHGIIRRASLINTKRIDHLIDAEDKRYLHYGDLADGIDTLLYEIQPDEIYNIGSMSHVRISFDIPVYTGDITGLGVVRILEGIRKMGLVKKTKFYQASSSEMFGITPPPQKEDTPFQPVSPYGCAKLYGYWITKSYRSGYGMFASNGILFNHESPRRGENFVTRKITRAAVRIKLGMLDKITLGNLDAVRDWGFAGDYVDAIWRILQHEVPEDFVISTGETHTVREFLEEVFSYLGLDPWKYVVTNDTFKRPNEVPALCGDSSKARKLLGWEPKYNFKSLVKLMVDEDYEEARKEGLANGIKEDTRR